MKIIDGFMITMIVIIVGLISFVIYMCYQQNKEIRQCFFQEPRTKECEYVLYRNTTRRSYVPVTIPVIMR